MLTGTELSLLYPYNPTRGITVGGTEKQSILKMASHIYETSLNRQLLTQRNDSPNILRASMMGRAAIDIMARKLLPHLYLGTLSPRIFQLFHAGDTWESDYYVWLASRGIEFISYQGELSWFDILGHHDFIVNINNRPVLLELKTANLSYFKSVKNAQSVEMIEELYGEYIPYVCHTMSDFRGHISQVHVYAAGLGIDDVVIVLYCKDTSEVLLYNVPLEDDTLQRLFDIAAAWKMCNRWEDAFYYVGIPSPRLELRNKNHTGRYLISPRLYGSPIIPLVYDWMDDDDKTLVTGYRLPDGAQVLQPMMDQYNEIGVTYYSIDEMEDLINEWRRYRNHQSGEESD